MDDHAGNIGQILGGFGEGGFDVCGCNPRICPFQGNGHLGGINMCKGARNTDIDFADFGTCLFFGVADGTADCLVELARIVPAFLKISVILRDTGRNNVAALASAVFGNQRNNLAGTEVDGRNRRFHSLYNLPCSGSTGEFLQINAHDRYYSLYNSIYENLLEMEKVGQITIETGSKGLGYLHELLMNDGPEFSYTVVFWEKNNAARKYKIGVCIRGLPICKPMKD